MNLYDLAIKFKDFEIWKDEGRNLILVRCKCWRSMMRDGIADNNGWYQFDRYPHAYWCKNYGH
jgi:hypothetical protein